MISLAVEAKSEVEEDDAEAAAAAVKACK